MLFLLIFNILNSINKMIKLNQVKNAIAIFFFIINTRSYYFSANITTNGYNGRYAPADIDDYDGTI